MHLIRLAERPQLLPRLHELGPQEWPAFMLEDPVGDLYYTRLEDFAEYVVVLLDGDRLVARGLSIPFAWTGRDADLPARGWDAMIETATSQWDRRHTPTAVSALEITVAHDRRGTGLSRLMVAALRDNAARLGFGDLVAPVRPTLKSAEPRTPMADYVMRRRGDGAPADPWMRVHWRLGARMVAVCPQSMTITGTVAQWRRWTGLPLTSSGAYDVPGALVPVDVDVQADRGTYIEPNVWMRHRLDV